MREATANAESARLSAADRNDKLEAARSRFDASKQALADLQQQEKPSDPEKAAKHQAGLDAALAEVAASMAEFDRLRAGEVDLTEVRQELDRAVRAADDAFHAEVAGLREKHNRTPLPTTRA